MTEIPIKDKLDEKMLNDVKSAPAKSKKTKEETESVKND